MNYFQTPVLITLWDKPDYVVQLMDAISIVKPMRIYLFSDIDNDRDSERFINIIKARKIAQEMITWDANVFCRFNEKNEGPSWGVHNAISWAFETTDRLIVLEHDYIPAKSFFPYCEELLEKYLNDERIWIISGLNHFEGVYNFNDDDSYFFSKYPSIAGFATWKRCWDMVDNEMKKWPLYVEKKYKHDSMDNMTWQRTLKQYKKFYNDQILTQNINTWDYQFGFAIWSNRGTGIVPAQNLIKMIGVEGYNTSGPSPFHFFKTDSNFKITKHPDFIQNNYIYDDMYFKMGYFDYYNMPFFEKAIYKIKRLYKKIIKKLEPSNG